VAKAQEYIQEGYIWVVDIDLEKFFDRVNHDVLMGRIAKRISDKRMLKLIRGFLNAGVMEDGLVGPTDEGTPQGGPLSPLLSNVLLDELDRELERRGHRFVRYADDCNIYVKSERAGQRVMEGVKHFLTRKLRLKVNESKSAVATGDCSLQGTDSGTHAAHTRSQYRTDDRRAPPLSDWMAGLLRILRDPQHAQGFGHVDP
jgi:RNA-directed DNA polymerase